MRGERRRRGERVKGESTHAGSIAKLTAMRYVGTEQHLTSAVKLTSTRSVLLPCFVTFFKADSLGSTFLRARVLDKNGFIKG